MRAEIMRTPAYYASGLFRQFVPYSLAERGREGLVSKMARYVEHSEIDDRVAYYNGLEDSFDASEAPRICDICRKRSRYYLDLDESCRRFGANRRVNYLFGDIIAIQDVPTVVKSRPIHAGNRNSVVLKLDKLRHFKLGIDPIPFRDKANCAVWRGGSHTKQRRDFVQRFYHHPTFDIGQSRGIVDDLSPKQSLTHTQQKQNKFFVSLEGNDVATNLKWGLASNMLVMAPRPRYETWFMEGRLEAGKHYVLLRDDLSDLEEKVDYYTSRTDEAENIIRNAHEWVNLFTDPLRERLIALRVMEKYFRLSGQL